MGRPLGRVRTQYAKQKTAQSAHQHGPVVSIDRAYVDLGPRFDLTLVTVAGSLSGATETVNRDLQAETNLTGRGETDPPRQRESIEAHLSIVFATIAVSHSIEHQTGWSIEKFIRTARRYRAVQIRAGQQTLTTRRRLSRRPPRGPRHDRLGQCGPN